MSSLWCFYLKGNKAILYSTLYWKAKARSMVRSCRFTYNFATKHYFLRGLMKIKCIKVKGFACFCQNCAKCLLPRLPKPVPAMSFEYIKESVYRKPCYFSSNAHVHSTASKVTKAAHSWDSKFTDLFSCLFRQEGDAILLLTFLFVKKCHLICLVV